MGNEHLRDDRNGKIHKALGECITVYEGLLWALKSQLVMANGPPSQQLMLLSSHIRTAKPSTCFESK